MTAVILWLGLETLHARSGSARDSGAVVPGPTHTIGHQDIDVDGSAAREVP